MVYSSISTTTARAANSWHCNNKSFSPTTSLRAAGSLFDEIKGILNIFVT